MNSPIAQTLLHAHDNRPPQKQAALGSKEKLSLHQLFLVSRDSQPDPMLIHYPHSH